MKLRFDRAALLKLVASIPNPSDNLHLVKDDGIYLMSFALPVPEGAKKRPVVYAKGYNPEVDGDIWEKCRAAVGGDDIGEVVGTREEFLRAFADSDGDLFVNVNAKTLGLAYLPKKKAATAPAPKAAPEAAALDKAAVRRLSADLNAVLQKFADANGLELSAHGGKFDASSFTPKVTLLVKGGAERKTNRDCEVLGYKVRFGDEFVSGRNTYVVVEVARGGSVVATLKGTTRRYKFSKPELLVPTVTKAAKTPAAVA